MGRPPPQLLGHLPPVRSKSPPMQLKYIHAWLHYCSKGPPTSKVACTIYGCNCSGSNGPKYKIKKNENRPTVATKQFSYQH